MISQKKKEGLDNKRGFCFEMKQMFNTLVFVFSECYLPELLASVNREENILLHKPKLSNSQ